MDVKKNVLFCYYYYYYYLLLFLDSFSSFVETVLGSKMQNHNSDITHMPG